MALNIQLPENTVMKPEITVFGIGGAGGNATNNMIKENLEGVNFVVANTDAQALDYSDAQKRIQLGQETTQGLGAGASPEVGRRAAEEAEEEIIEHLKGSNMVFITAGMGGGTGTGAAPVIARIAREHGILTVGVVTKPFHFEGPRRMKIAEEGLEELQEHVDTLIVIPNQNLFRIANEKTTFADAFKLADNVLHRGVRGVTDLMVMPGLINLDFADVKAVMGEMGKAMMGTGEAEGERRAQEAAEAAISNPLLDNVSMKGARGVLINITGGSDMTLFEVDEAANRIREEVDPTANIIFGSTFNEALEGRIRVSVVATGIDSAALPSPVTRTSFVNEPVKEAATEEDSEPTQEQLEAAQTAVNSLDEIEAQIRRELASEDESRTEEELGNAEEDNIIAPEPEEQNDTNEETPSNVDQEYFDAIRQLNEEYKSKLESVEKAAKEDNADDEQENNYGGFISPAPVQPGNYVESDINSFSEDTIGQQANDEQLEKAISGRPQKGLFSRMAKALQSSNETEADDDSASGGIFAEEDAKAESKQEEEDDLMDIPAFLRRKA